MSSKVRPIVIKVKRRDRDQERQERQERKYTKGVQSIQMSEVSLTRGANRMADAVSAGFKEYRRRRDQSSFAKKDGMLMDWVPNVGEGVAETLRLASPVASDIASAINHREFRNAMRFFAKTMTDFKYPRR